MKFGDSASLRTAQEDGQKRDLVYSNSSTPVVKHSRKTTLTSALLVPTDLTTESESTIDFDLIQSMFPLNTMPVFQHSFQLVARKLSHYPMILYLEYYLSVKTITIMNHTFIGQKLDSTENLEDGHIRTEIFMKITLTKYSDY